MDNLEKTNLDFTDLSSFSLNSEKIISNFNVNYVYYGIGTLILLAIGFYAYNNYYNGDIKYGDIMCNLGDCENKLNYSENNNNNNSKFNNSEFNNSEFNNSEFNNKCNDDMCYV